MMALKMIQQPTGIRLRQQQRGAHVHTSDAGWWQRGARRRKDLCLTDLLRKSLLGLDERSRAEMDIMSQDYACVYLSDSCWDARNR